jgi:hypothetical protein
MMACRRPISEHDRDRRARRAFDYPAHDAAADAINNAHEPTEIMNIAGDTMHDGKESFQFAAMVAD